MELTIPDADGSPLEDGGADRIRIYDRHVTCEGDPEEGTFVDAEDAGASGLRNVGGGEWAFSWQSQGSWESPSATVLRPDRGRVPPRDGLHDQ